MLTKRRLLWFAIAVALVAGLASTWAIRRTIPLVEFRVAVNRGDPRAIVAAAEDLDLAELDREYLRAWVTAVAVLTDHDRRERAAERIHAATRRHPEHLDLMEASVATHWGLEGHPRAVGTAHELLKRRPQHLVAHLYLAQLSMRAGAVQTAHESYLAAHAADTENQLWTDEQGLAWTTLHLDGREAAQAHFDAFLAREDVPESISRLDHFTLALLDDAEDLEPLRGHLLAARSATGRARRIPLAPDALLAWLEEHHGAPATPIDPPVPAWDDLTPRHHAAVLETFRLRGFDEPPIGAWRDQREER